MTGDTQQHLGREGGGAYLLKADSGEAAALHLTREADTAEITMTSCEYSNDSFLSVKN